MEQEVQNQSQRPWFFNLRNDGDSAVVRLLHSTTSTIETVSSHRVTIGDKSKRVRCLGENCPLCLTTNSDKRIYVHLFDYTDNKEKVWDRTDKIISQFESLQQSWNPLNSAVIKITRVGNEFPKYTIEVQNPNNYSDVDKALIDKQVAKWYSMKKTVDEMNTFIKTGEFPERKPYIPKEEYYKQKEAEKQVNNIEQQKQIDNNSNNSIVENNTQTQNNDFDPFADSIIVKPRKV